ncbi:MAG: hypothetical protein ACI4TF_00235 [Oliverpabstia sp.]
MKCRRKKEKKQNQSLEECPSEEGKQKQRSLQAEKTDHSPIYSFYTGIRRAFFRILNKRKLSGSMTAEAVVTVPIFLLTVSTLLSILDIYRVQALVKNSLHQSALELGTYAYVSEKGQDTPAGIISSSACAIYAKTRIPYLGDYVKVSTSDSVYENHTVKLRARIEYRIPLSIVPFPKLYFYNESQVDSWVGKGTEDKTGIMDSTWEEMVYVSEYESVYHTNASCSHLELAVHQDVLNHMESLRNAYGNKYHMCEKCGIASSGNTAVYYTEKGDCYHMQEECSGLKRTVRLVKKSETEGIHQCQRCMAKEAS